MFLLPDDGYAIRRTKDRGRGAFATHDIAPGTVIGDYLGMIVRPSDENERKNGLYQMQGGARYDVLPSPRSCGIHLINDSCAHNCAMYPYRGHILYVALRTMFRGEELTVAYDIDPSGDCGVPCAMHACRCGSRICTGTMHGTPNVRATDAWETLKKKEFGPYYRSRIPGHYGEALAPLSAYPASVPDHPAIWDIFGAEGKQPFRCTERALPPLSKLRTRIRKTGRQLSFPSLRMRVLGIRDDFLIAERS